MRNSYFEQSKVLTELDKIPVPSLTKQIVQMNQNHQSYQQIDNRSCQNPNKSYFQRVSRNK
jgi:hypothetical protein